MEAWGVWAVSPQPNTPHAVTRSHHGRARLAVVRDDFRPRIDLRPCLLARDIVDPDLLRAVFLVRACGVLRPVFFVFGIGMLLSCGRPHCEQCATLRDVYACLASSTQVRTMARRSSALTGLAMCLWNPERRARSASSARA